MFGAPALYIWGVGILAAGQSSTMTVSYYYLLQISTCNKTILFVDTVQQPQPRQHVIIFYHPNCSSMCEFLTLPQTAARF